MPATYRDTHPYEPFVLSAEVEPISEKIKDGFPLTDAIDWFWRNFVSENGEGFRDYLIKPLVGDYSRIAENGKAWRNVEKQMSGLAANLTDNAHVLLDGSWSGKAADSFENLVEEVWAPALALGETTAQFIGIGFEKFSAAVVQVGKAACRVLDVIVKSIAKLAKKASPWGAAVSLFEWVVSGFEGFPYWDDVAEIVETIKKVDELKVQLREMVALFGKYLAAGEGLLDAFLLLPEINSTTDLFYIGKKVATGARGIEKANEESRVTRARHRERREEILRKAGEGG